MITIDIKNNTNEIIGNASFKLKEAKDLHAVEKGEIFLSKGWVCIKDKFFENTIAYEIFSNEKIEISATDRNNVCYTLELVEG